MGGEIGKDNVVGAFRAGDIPVPAYCACTGEGSFKLGLYPLGAGTELLNPIAPAIGALGWQLASVPTVVTHQAFVCPVKGQ